VPDYQGTDEDWGRHLELADLAKRNTLRVFSFEFDGHDSHMLAVIDEKWARRYVTEADKPHLIKMAFDIIRWATLPPKAQVRPED